MRTARKIQIGKGNIDVFLGESREHKNTTPSILWKVCCVFEIQDKWHDVSRLFSVPIQSFKIVGAAKFDFANDMSHHHHVIGNYSTIFKIGAGQCMSLLVA